jgi:N6-adenosine-specific RNA methylase IME4
MEIIKYNKARFEKNKLTIYEDITIDEWKELGQGLRQVEGSVQFWIGDWARYGDKRGFTGKYTDPKVYDELENITGLNRGTIQNYKSVAERTSSLRSEDLTFNHHVEVAKLTPEKQELYLNMASEENLSVRDLRNAIRKDGVKYNKNTEELSGIFQLFYADPPWQYGNAMPKGTTTPENYYPCMSLEDICSMPINAIADENAVLFIWVTSPLLEESFEVINAWGFKYKTSFIWDKIKHNMGHYSSVRHELLLLCTKGSYPIQNMKLYDSVYSEERTEHSKKPDFYYEMIEYLYPNSNKLELFSRNKREGWTTYGNQL